MKSLLRDSKFYCAAAFLVGFVASSASASMIDDGFGRQGLNQTQLNQINVDPLVAPLAPAQKQKELGASPFAQACLDPESRSAMIETGLFRREVPFTDLRGRSARSFLKRIADLVAIKIRTNRRLLDGFDDCLGPAPKNPKCPVLQEFADKHLVDYVHEARMHLALAQTEHQLSSLTFRARRDLNASLDSLGTYKFVSWQPLDATETSAALQILREYGDEIDIEVQKRIASGELPKPRPWIVKGREEFFDHPETLRFRNDAMLAARFGHAESYRALIAEYPIIQFMTTPHPTRADILNAVAQMRLLLKDEEQFLNKTLKAIEQTDANKRGSREKLTSLNTDALQILNYRRLVEIELLGEPEDCSVAAGLLITKENRELGNSLAIGLPILASGFVLSPILGVPIGIAAGIGLSMESKWNLEHAERQYLSQVRAIPMAGDLDEVEAADKDYKFNLWTLPLAFAGSQVVAAKLGLNLGAAKIGANARLKLMPKFFRTVIR